MIAGAPPVRALPAQWLALRVDRAEEIPEAVRMLLDAKDLKGVHLHPGNGMDLWKAFKAGYVAVKAAGGMVLDEHGRLLVIHRSGRWDLPKGKVDPGETIAEAAVREVQEECGIGRLEAGPQVARTWHTYERGGRQHLKRTDWFLMRASSGEDLLPQEEEGIEEVRWLSHAEAETFKAGTYPSLLPVVAAWEAVVAGAR